MFQMIVHDSAAMGSPMGFGVNVQLGPGLVLRCRAMVRRGTLVVIIWGIARSPGGEFISVMIMSILLTVL